MTKEIDDGMPGYAVATGRDIAHLEYEADALIENGYRPVGGLAVVEEPSGSGGLRFFQAMYRSGEPHA
jgi:hypothetical protein